MIKRKTKNSPFSPCATLHPTSSSPPGHSGRPLCLTWHPELGRVHEILGKEPMNFPFLNRSRRWDFVASKGRFEDNYENVQMFKCSNAKTLKITPHTTQVVFFFSRRMIRHIAKKRGASQTSDHSETSSCSGDEFLKTRSDFSDHLVIHKTTDPKPKTWILENDTFHPYTTPPNSLHLKRHAVGKSFPCRTICSKKAEEVQQTNKSNT